MAAPLVSLVLKVSAFLYALGGAIGSYADTIAAPNEASVLNLVRPGGWRIY